MNDTLKILENRRSCRSFKPDSIKKEELNAIIKAGTYAPTGMGKQSPIIIAVTDKNLRDAIAEENRKIGGWDEGFDPFYGAPVILIVLADRKSKEKSEIAGEEIWIDGFNTVITLEVMLSGSILFECVDGTIRDLAALRGTYRIIPETEGAVRILLDVLMEMKAGAVYILLDQPVSNSGRLKTLIADIGERYPISLDIQILKEVDKELWTKENVITSDSIILDHCKSWVNLMRKCVDKHGEEPIRVWDIEK